MVEIDNSMGDGQRSVGLHCSMCRPALEELSTQ